MPKINFLGLSSPSTCSYRLSLSFSKENPLRKELWTTPFPSPVGHFSSTYLLPMFLMGKHSPDSDVEIRDVATNEEQIKNTFSRFTRSSASQHTASTEG